MRYDSRAPGRADDNNETTAEGDAAVPRATVSPEVAAAVSGVVTAASTTDQSLERELLRLEATYESSVYSEMIFLLSHLSFDPDEAKKHWQSILSHRDSMQNRIGSFVDLRVALLDYFVQVDRKLRNPKIIEFNIFEQTRASAYRDELTGLYNYRFFNECLEREIQRCERCNTPLSLAMVDIDFFKEYNDRNGHQAGNEVLLSIARLLRETLRTVDIPTRFGGEEFALILPMTPKTGAALVADKVRIAIERHSFPNESTLPGEAVTVSMGIATFPGDSTEAGALVRFADYAMYAAKARGRNQVQLYGQSTRSYRRIDISLDGEFRALSAEPRTFKTVNISEGGLLFATDGSLPAGTLVDIILRLPDHEVGVSGRVAHAGLRDDDAFQVAVRFLEMQKTDRMHLAKFIRALSPPPDDSDAEGENPLTTTGR